MYLGHLHVRDNYWYISAILLFVFCDFLSVVFFLSLFLTSSVQFSRSVMSDSLRPHELQHARPPCPSLTPRVHSDSRPSSQWCHPAISSSVVPFSSCPKSLPASESFPMSQHFHEVAKVLEFQLQHQSFQWTPSTGRVRLCATSYTAATRFPHPWDSPGKNTGVGCHFLLPCMKGKSESEVAQSCPTLSDPMDCSPPGSSSHRILQASVLECVASAFSIQGYDYILNVESSCNQKQSWAKVDTILFGVVIQLPKPQAFPP